MYETEIITRATKTRMLSHEKQRWGDHLCWKGKEPEEKGFLLFSSKQKCKDSCTCREDSQYRLRDNGQRI